MKKKIFFKSKVLLLSLVFLCMTILGSVSASASTAYTGMRNITSLELVKEMKLGWNLGNTLDAPGGETDWGNPITTKAMIDEIKKSGFNTVRTPVTWYTHVGSAPDYTIDSTWLDRVEEIVNYVLDNDMYAIINLHHEDWLVTTYAGQSETTNELTKIWTQIANRFKNYSDYLIFETMNEPRLRGTEYEWTGGTPEARDVINKYNLAAVNTIRGTGGNNQSRHIMIPTHAASALSVAVNDLVIPNNDSRIIVSLHMYSPYFFAMDINGTSTWGSSSDKSSLDSEFDAVYNKFVKNGRAVVIGEFGTINKNNESSRVVHAEYYTKAAKARGLTAIWWDNGFSTAGAAESYSLFNRNTLSWDCPSVAQALVNGVGGSVTEPTPTPVPGYKAALAVNYTSWDWGTGATINITIKNNGTADINGWTLGFTFPGNQQINNIWGGSYTQNDTSVSVVNEGYNSVIGANGGTVSFGFNISYSGTNDAPASFILNGTDCSIY